MRSKVMRGAPCFQYNKFQTKGQLHLRKAVSPQEATNPAPYANLYSIAIYDLSGNFCVTFGITKDRMPFSYFALMSSFETSSPT